MLDKFREAFSRPMYWIPKILLIILCMIHDKTKYHTARSIQELFYWPEGLCLDMLVLALFGIEALWCCWEDGKIFSGFLEDENSDN